MSDIRVADTAQLSDIARAGDIHQFTARLKRDLLSRLAPGGYHVLILTNRLHVDGRHTVRHHRVRALLKLQGDLNPTIVTLDVSTRSWDDLPTTTDALRAQNLLQELS